MSQAGSANSSSEKYAALARRARITFITSEAEMSSMPAARPLGRGVTTDGAVESLASVPAMRLTSFLNCKSWSGLSCVGCELIRYSMMKVSRAQIVMPYVDTMSGHFRVQIGYIFLGGCAA